MFLIHEWLSEWLPPHDPAKVGTIQDFKCTLFVPIFNWTLEFPLMATYSLLFLWMCVRGCKKHAPAFEKQKVPPCSLDYLLAVMLVFSMVYGSSMKVFYSPLFGHPQELEWGNIPFIVQPCHIYCLVLAWALTTNSPGGRAAFQVFATAGWWSAGLALLFPATGDLEGLEYAMFWVEHWVLMLAPLSCLLRGRYTVLVDLSWGMVGYWITATFHVLLIVPISVVTRTNVASMCQPPPALADFGGWYRWVIFGVFFVCANLWMMLIYPVLHLDPLASPHAGAAAKAHVCEV